MKTKLLAAFSTLSLLAVTGCQSRSERIRDAQHDANQTIQHDEQRRAEVDRDLAQKNADLSRDENRAQREADRKIADAQNDDRRDVGVGQSGAAHDDAATTVNRPLAGTAMSIVGTVKDASGGSVSLVTNDGELKLKSDDQTRVICNGQPLKMGDIKEGQQVRAAYRYDGHDNKAYKIEVMGNTPAR